MNLVTQFCEWEKKVEALEMAFAIMGVDNTAVPPSQGRKHRDEHTAILAGELFKLQNDPEMFDVMEKLLSQDSQVKGQLDETFKESKEDIGDFIRRVELYHEMASKQKEIPVDKYMAFSRILEKSKVAWLKAKEEEDWKSFAPIQKEVFEGQKELLAYQDRGNLSDFDKLLDEHEPGMTAKEYDNFFNLMKERLVPIIRNNADKDIKYIDLRSQEYPVEKQRLYMAELLKYIGFTSDWGKISESEHPLTSWISAGDIRFTTHYRSNNPVDSVLSTIHESGHGWYAHNVSEKYDGTVIANSVSAAMHESQSRFCENHLGRSRAFWEVQFPKLQAYFPDELGNISLDDFYQAVNESHPSLIRTQADELTYPLHILIRYELEKEIFTNKLDPMDLEEAWNQKYKDYLGLEVPGAGKGVLQDMHWPYAYFGYFPTYALGSAYAAQFDYYMRKDIDPDKLLKENRYVEIMAWLREKVQKYGNRYNSDTVLKLATGEGFNPKYYLDYLENKYRR